MIKFTISVLFFLLLLVFPASILAQTDIDFDTALKNYISSYEPYESSRRDYTLARSQYLKFKTLKSESEARNATLKFLQTRDDIVINYLIMLKAKVREETGIIDSEKAIINIRLNEELSWFTEHKNRLTSADTLADLVADSESAKERYKVLPSYFSQIKTRLTLGKLLGVNERVVDVFSELKTKVDVIKNESRPEYQVSSKKLQTIDRWITESDNRLIRFREKADTAQTQISALSRETVKNPNYDPTLQLLEEGRQYLRSSLSYLIEVIREIKLTEG